MASAIPSVTGPIAGPDLGQVLVHEHVVCGAAGVTRSAAALAGGFEALIERGVTALQAARAEGLTTMVDATPFDLGRDVELLAEVSRRSGVTILAATGHWLLPSVFMANRSVSELAEMFVADLTTGADGTSIRCGVMKVASEEEITAFDRRVSGGGRDRAPRDRRADHHPRRGAQPHRRGAGGGVRRARRGRQIGWSSAMPTTRTTSTT